MVTLCSRAMSIKIFLFEVICYSFLFDICYGITYRTYATPADAKYNEYAPKVKSKTCLLRPREGPCRADITMYYFIPENMTCGTFKWGGCQGNGNRFDTLSECRSTCISKQYDKRVQPTFCSLEFDYGFCFGSIPRWYFNRRSQVCKKSIYSGCGGNKNNFYTKQNCENTCLWLKDNLRKARKATTKTPKAPAGKSGEKGAPGKPGELGEPGKPGKSGESGEPGKSVEGGAEGKAGEPGEPGNLGGVTPGAPGSSLGGGPSQPGEPGSSLGGGTERPGLPG